MGKSLEVSSVVLDNAAHNIAIDHGAMANMESLEKVLPSGKNAVRVYGQMVEIGLYILMFANEVEHVVVDSIRQTLRSERDSLALIALVGGGAEFCRSALQDAFPKVPVAATRDSVFSIARGFWYMGSSI